jgi:hypothetical protein
MPACIRAIGSILNVVVMGENRIGMELGLMSNRTLIEINHDLCHRLDDNFVPTLNRYLRSASRETAEALGLHGVRVISMRHHSGKFIIDGTPDGFPVRHLERPKT